MASADRTEKLRSILGDERVARLEQVLAQRTRHLTVVLENLYDSHNLSAVLRTADAFGVQEVHVVDEDGDPVPDAVLSVDVRSGQADRRNVPYDLVTDGRGVVHAGPLPAGGELCSLALLDLGDAFELLDLRC